MVPSKTTPAAEKTDPIQGHVVGQRSAMRVPRNNGEKRRLKNGINGSVETIGASQNARISFSRRRLGSLSIAHDRPAFVGLRSSRPSTIPVETKTAARIAT